MAPFWVGWRYLNVASRSYSTLVNWVSVIGLACGVMLFIVVASVQNGLLIEVHSRYMSVVPHAFLPQNLSDDDLKRIASTEGVQRVERFFRGTGMVFTPESSYVVQLYGLSDSDSVATIDAVVSGQLENLSDNGIAMNDRLVNDMGLTVGDHVSVTMARPRANGVQPIFASFKLIATFEFGVDLDYSVAFVSVSNIEQRGLSDTGEIGNRVWVSDYMAADQIFADIPGVETWSKEFGELFLGFQLEKVMLSVFMALVILLASFNLVAAQTMVINTKRSDIAILTTMGASEAFVFRIFALQGAIIAVTGIILGIILGVVISLNAGTIMDFIERLTQIAYVQDTVLNSLPARIEPGDVVASIVVALVASSVAVIYPVKKVLNTSPVAALNQQA